MISLSGWLFAALFLVLWTVERRRLARMHAYYESALAQLRLSTATINRLVGAVREHT